MGLRIIVSLNLFSLVQKARIKSQDTLADALQTAYQRLKTHTSGGTDLDAEILVRLASSFA